MEPEALRWLVGQGGFALAFVVLFYFYRKDVQQFTELWKNQSEALIEVVKENTASNTRLIASVDSMQGLLAQVMAFVASRDAQARRRLTDREP